MRIKDVKVYVVETGCSVKWVFVEVETDEGIRGFSEASTVFREYAQAYVIKELKPYILGKDPLDIRKNFNQIYKSHLDVRGPGSLEITALGAIEVACWDILGKKTNMPIYSLLGGKCNEKIRAYVHCEPVFPKEEHDSDWIAKNAAKLVDEGYKHLKFDPFWFYPEEETINLKELNEAEDKVKKVRETVGKDIEVGIEIHAKYNLPSAIKICTRLEKYMPWFFEEPVGSEDPQALKIIANTITTPITSGERLCTRYAFKDMITEHCVDIIQIDPVRAGGFIESLAIANMAETYTIPTIIHDPYGPIYDAICTQFATTIPNLFAMEYPKYYYITKPEDLRNKIVENHIKFEKGYITASKEPGLGVEVNEETLKKYSKIIE
ncbi:MAG: mandelate racemase/muconate lactonizing enzyme family protein [Nitrososphaeria archaeon]